MTEKRYTINSLPQQICSEKLDLLNEVETATIGHFRLTGFASPAIKPLKTGHRIAGTAVTLILPGLDSTLLHHVIADLRPGDILVIDRLGDRNVSCLGGGVAYALKKAGVSAAVIDGPCNDPYEILDLEFPVWSRGISPITTRLYNTGGAFNVPICCGGAVVLPGDVVLADDNGVVFFRSEDIEHTAKKAVYLQQLEKEILPTLNEERTLGELSGASKMVLSAINEQ